MKLTLKQAANETGKTKQGIQQAIKNGRISAGKDSKGEWEIDPAELFRVYPPVNKIDTNRLTEIDSTLHPPLYLKVKELELELNAANKEKDFYQGQLANTQNQLQESKVKEDRLLGLLEHNTRLLEDRRSPPPVPTGTPEAKEPEVQPEKASNWLWAKTAPISYWILMFILACLGAFAIYMTYLYGQNPDTAIDLIDKILAHRFNPF
jgi:hypothetical protein